MNKNLSKEETGKYKYAINFSVFYETTFGQEIWVLGSIKELGQWKEYKLKLFWSDGHCWINKEPLLVNSPYFEYKYALFGVDGQLEIFENGINRIADLETLPSQDTGTSLKQSGQPKLIYIHDVWETYNIRFTLFDPLYEHGDMMFMVPNPGSGLNSTIQMERTRYEEEWLTAKYGKPVQLWQCVIPLTNEHGDSEG